VNEKALKDLHKDSAWLKRELEKEGIENMSDVFLCLWQKNGFFVIKKEIKSRNTLF
jgi:uncharacterized membrane protein YcaP (DUF421 family)